jgi:hypothetical protein
MQNIHVVSRPEFHVLSNGALASAVSLILCTGKWTKHFTEADLAFNLHFQHIGLDLQENQVHHSKERNGLETTFRFTIYFVFAHDFYL